jgi:hypothetical protein
VLRATAETDRGPVGVGHGGRAFPPADVPDLPAHLGAGLDQRVPGAGAAVDMVIADPPGHPSAVTVRIEPDVVVPDPEVQVEGPGRDRAPSKV